MPEPEATRYLITITVEITASDEFRAQQAANKITTWIDEEIELPCTYCIDHPDKE